jgi:hypothetical protein
MLFFMTYVLGFFEAAGIGLPVGFSERNFS